MTRREPKDENLIINDNDLMESKEAKKDSDREENSIK